MVTNYAIAILLASTAALAYGLQTSLKSNGELEANLSVSQADLQLAQEQIGSVAKAYATDALELDKVLVETERRRYNAQRKANRAQAELDDIKRDECFDTALPDRVVDGLSRAYSAYVPTASCVQTDTNIPHRASTNARDISAYSLQLMESLDMCNSKLQSIREYSNSD
ncbi:hypothetical protein N9937_01950 [bacterium]|nr:hypothetical protein [bacterium]